MNDRQATMASKHLYCTSGNCNLDLCACLKASQHLSYLLASCFCIIFPRIEQKDAEYPTSIYLVYLARQPFFRVQLSSQVEFGYIFNPILSCSLGLLSHSLTIYFFLRQGCTLQCRLTWYLLYSHEWH